jgi:hypothetical protein
MPRGDFTVPCCGEETKRGFVTARGVRRASDSLIALVNAKKAVRPTRLVQRQRVAEPALSPRGTANLAVVGGNLPVVFVNCQLVGIKAG